MSIQHPVALEVPLTPTSYLVLGLLEREGPSTPYELKRHVAATIGHIWSFPHALLYKEPARLAALGLLSEERELIGRRRRLFTITPAGREALRIWLGRPAQHPTELRDLALLQLFFSDLEIDGGHARPRRRAARPASATARELRGRPGPGEPDREPDDGTLARRHRQDGRRSTNARRSSSGDRSPPTRAHHRTTPPDRHSSEVASEPLLRFYDERMQVDVNGTRLWFDVDGPLLEPAGTMMRN